MLIKKHCLSHCRSSPVSFSLPHCLNVYPSNLPLIPSSFLTFYVCLLPQPPFHSLSMVPTFPTLSLPCSSSCFSLLPPSFLFISMSIPCSRFHRFLIASSFSLDLSQSVIVKSVERNAVNMYEARKFLLGLESNGVVSSSPPVALNAGTNGPSPSLICPVGLDILASAGLGLSNLGNDNV